MTPLADVPAVVLTGLRGAGKTTLLARLLRERPADEHLAVLLTELGDAGLPPMPNATVVAADPGCVCCVGQVSLRVALTRLLREARPQRLYIELAEPAHLARALATLRSPWLAPVLDITAVVGVADASSAPRDAATAAWLARLTVLHVRNDADGAFVAFARGERPELELR